MPTPTIGQPSPTSELDRQAENYDVTKTIIDAAREIRPFLADLVGDDAQELDTELARLLDATAHGEDTDAALRQLFGARQATLDWAAFFLEHQIPPEQARFKERSEEDAWEGPRKLEAMPAPGTICTHCSHYARPDCTREGCPYVR